MKKIYKAKIEKKRIGSAVEHKLPELKGTIVTSVYDITTDGDYRLFVVDCDKTQHKFNQKLKGVEELSEDDAISLAEEYQPERKAMTIDPKTMKEEEIIIPKCDLKAYLT